MSSPTKKDDRPSPAKSEDKPSPASSKGSKAKDNKGSADAESPEDHVSGPPVKQSLFSKMKTGLSAATSSMKDLRGKYLPAKDTGDNEDEAERPKTATKTSTDDDGPVWEPGTEQLMWTDPTYVVQNFVQPGIHPNHNRHFVKPEAWWNSAEEAIKMLEAERRGLKPASLDQQNFMARAMLATNRLIASRIQGMATNAKDQNRFRGGVEAIQHVLPPDVQRALHSKLCSAVKNGEKEIIDMLLKFDIDLDYSDHFGTALHYAAFFGQLQASHILLDKGAFPGALNYRDQTPLHIASSKNAHTVVDLLVRYGAPLNATDMGGLTAMHMASEHGFTKVVDTLIMGGADCDKPNRVGWTPLHLASMGMHHNIIERLCISGMANPNLGCCQTRNVIMGKGTRSYIFPVVNGDTPLHFSARSSHFMCLKVLLENSADVNAVNEHNETPMHLAAHSCDLRCVERLLEYGMDFIDIEDKQGRDPIDVCDDVLSENAGLDDDSVRIRGVVNEIKTMLQRTSVKKNQQAHRALMEQAKKGVGGRKKLQNDTAPAVDGDGDNALEIEEKSMDDRTMEDKIAAMNVELLAARAEAQAAQAQSRMKTYELNESLMETRRRLVETEFMLERERESRVSLEQEVLGLIGAHEDVQNLKGGFSDKDDFDGPSTRGRSAESSYDPTRRMGTAEGTIDYGAGYERMRLGTAVSEMFPRSQSTKFDDYPGPSGSTRTPSGVRKMGRAFSSSTLSVKFSETQTHEYSESETLDDELEEYERSEDQRAWEDVNVSRPASRQASAAGGVLKHSGGRYSGARAQRFSQEDESQPRDVSPDVGKQPSDVSPDIVAEPSRIPTRTVSNVTFRGISPESRGSDEG